jgi:hypothetical protein
MCDSFLDVQTAMEGGQVAGLLPNFLTPGARSKSFVRIHAAKIDSRVFCFHLAWNPRLMRLNPHTISRRDRLADALIKQMAE